jgi:hypothetical protein
VIEIKLIANNVKNMRGQNAVGDGPGEADGGLEIWYMRAGPLCVRSIETSRGGFVFFSNCSRAEVN